MDATVDDLDPAQLLNLRPDTQRALFEQRYPSGIQGISPAIADAIAGLFAGEASTRNFKVDRVRLAECWEAWIHVLVDAPESLDPLAGADFSPLLGFGRVAGIVTWPNSD